MVKGQKDENGGLVEVRIVLRGESPMLHNTMSIEQLIDMRGGIKKPKTAEKVSLREEADSKVHLDDKKRPIVPGYMLYACLVNAGQHVRLDGKRQVSSAKATVLPGMLTLRGNDFIIYVPDSKTDEIATWEVDIRKGTNPGGGEAVCLVRPRFDQWELRVTAAIDRRMMPLPMARELFDVAGTRIGLGDFRPQRRGLCGRFKVVLWEPLAARVAA